MRRSAGFALMILASMLAGCGGTAPTRHGAKIPAEAAPKNASTAAPLGPGRFRVLPTSLTLGATAGAA